MDFVKHFSNFDYFGICVYAYTNEKGEIKKGCIQPPKIKYEHTPKYFEPIFDYTCGSYLQPNGIQINTKNISVIDVDEPKKCIILDKLINDCKFYVKTRKGYHFYFNKCESVPRDKFMGIADINIQKLWYVPEYQHMDENIKDVYKYELVKSKKLVDMPQYAIDWCNMLISMTPENIKAKKTTINKTVNKEEIIIKPDIKIEKVNLECLESIYKIFYDACLFNKMNDWFSVGYMSRHLNNSNGAFMLFDKYSRKVEGYENNTDKNNRKCFYGKGDYNVNFDINGVLMKCKKLDINEYKKTLYKLTKSKYDDITEKVNLKFIFESDDKIFKNWYDEDIKALCIKSIYGSGKTYAFKKILDIYKPKKVLFITYRQSLAISFSQDLKEKYGFDNYLDDKENISKSNRAIIQLDSLHRLKTVYNILLQNDTIPFYDLIVLDEIEGLLNHLSFEKIDQYFIHQILYNLVKKATKILCLDGDMGERTYDFITDITDSYKLVVNKYKGVQKTFIINQNHIDFDERIEKDLIKNKKIVIVCMSAAESDKYHNKYKNDYRCLLHNSKERNKNMLLDVNKNWADCDILIYSPMVESGIDFNIINYFYSCYAYLTHRSTSYRAFFQMLNRVRYFENNEINCLLDTKTKYKIDEILCTFDEMKLEKWGQIEINNLTTILIHNDIEKYNSNKYFMTCIYNTIISKGHKYIFLDNYDKKLKKESMKKELIQDIINSADIDKNQFEELLTKQKRNEELTRNQNNQILKYRYKKVFILDELTPKIMDSIYMKFDIIKKYNMLNYDLIKNKNAYLKNFEKDRINQIHNIIKLLGYEIKNNKINMINGVLSSEIKDKISKICKSKKFKLLMNMDIEMYSNNFNSYLSKLFDNYGLKFSTTEKRRYVDKVQIKDYTFKITHNDIISKYINRKKDIEYKKAYDYYYKLEWDEINDKLNEALPYTRTTDKQMEECDKIFKLCEKLFIK